MAFTVNKADGSIAAIVNDYTGVEKAGITLQGYGFANYAENMAESLLHIIEHFSSQTPPRMPVVGQFWYNPNTSELSICRADGTEQNPNGSWTVILTVDANGARVAYADSSGQSNTAGEADLAKSANKLTTPRNINDTPFDGTQDISFDTDKVEEGANNLYFTNTRAISAARNAISISGGGSDLTYDPATGVITYSPPNVGVTSVNGKTGDVILTKEDIGLSEVENKSSATIRGELTATNVNDALGYVPYDSSNPNGFLNGINSQMVLTALGYIPLNQDNYTAQDVLTKLLQVDGPGSNINSDFLDNQHGAYYLDRANHTGTFPASALYSQLSLTLNGYYNLGGFMLQWGHVSVPNDRRSEEWREYVRSFNVSFPNQCFIVMICPRDSSIFDPDEDDEFYWAYPISRTQYRIGMADDGRSAVSSFNFSWIALGM